ncbi:MAG: hypothetical protein E7Z86_09110 [Methanosphaera stadtmanae]|jgi:C4-dicarboxylate transporter|nr:hypothetical protein [Methanosphaera stadtmanae]
MNHKQKLRIVKILWLITSVIIIVAATYLLIYGEASDRVVGIIGYILLIIEAVLYHKGMILH